MKKQSLEERWLSKIDVSSDVNSCWMWKGGRTNQGYGKIIVDKKIVLAHQIGWQLVGKSQYHADYYLRNRCGNKLCVNPYHWEKELRQNSLPRYHVNISN